MTLLLPSKIYQFITHELTNYVTKMLYNITHTTVYRYDEPVPLAHHLLRLRPRAHPRQRCETCDIMVDPRPTIRADHDDHFGNHTTFVTVEGGHRELTVTARSRVELLPPEDYLTASLWGRPPACRFPEPLAPWTKSSEFTFDSPLIKTVPMYADYAGSCFPAGRPLIEGAMDLTGRIYRDFQFDPEATTISTPVDEVFKNRRGVCQDFAHLEIACLRSLGIPARYVSGYIETTPPPGKPRLAGADASHAWISVYCEGAGWVDFDPTNNVIPSTRHITVAWGRDYSDVSPIRGVILGSGDHSLRVAVDVVPAT